MSYKVYAGTQTAVGVWDTKACIYDPTGEDLRTTATLLISPTLTREAGKAGSFEFTLPLGNVAHSALQKLKTIVEVEQDGTPIWRGRVMSHDMDFYLRQKVYCEGELAYLNDTALTPYQYQNISIREFLENVIRNHNSQTDKYKAFEVGNVTVFADGPQEPFKTVYMTGCYTDHSSADEDGDRDYWLNDADGRYVGDVDSDNPSVGYVGGNVIRIISKNSTGVIGKTTYTAERALAYKDGSFYAVTVTAVQDSVALTGQVSKYLYKLGTTPLTNWRLGDDGQIQRNVSGSWVNCTGYSLHDFDVSTNEALSFGDGKNFGVTWDILQSELTDVYGGYLVVRYSDDGKTRYLDYLTDAAESNTQTVEFGVNMLDLNNYVKADDIVTRVIAVGYQKKGWWIFKSTKTIQEMANDKAAQSVYGIITRVIVIDGKSITRQKLLDTANEELSKNLRYLDGMEISAVDLRDAGIDTERLGWMKKTHVLSKPHGLDTWLVLTKVVEPLDAPDKKKFTFGTSFYSISDLQALSSHKASMAYSIALSSMGYLNGNPIPTTSKTSAQ